MTTYTWMPGTVGDWLTANNWQPAGVPGVGDTAVFQPASGSGLYKVTVGVDDVIGVSAIQFSSAPEQNADLLIAGSMTVATLSYAAFEVPAQINVLAGGSLNVTSAITDDTATPETLSVAGTGAGGTLILGSTSVNDAAVTFDFVNNASGGNSGHIVFGSGYAPGVTVTQTITNFAAGDTLQFANANFTGDTATYDPSTTTLTVTKGTDTLLRLVNVSAPADESFNLAGGSIIAAVCYASGTRIRTPAGERRVETLRSGDKVVTLVGGEQVVQPVKRVGRRRIDLTTCPRPDIVAPIRIRRGAIADDMPHRDLRVSPDHAILVDGKLVCARQLVNGMSIQQEKGAASVEYFHVELATHAILLAEGLPAESYLNTGNSGFFAKTGTSLSLHPNLTDQTSYPLREADSVAPFIWREDSVRPIWQRLIDRARAQGQTIPQRNFTTDPDLHVLVGGRRVSPLHSGNDLVVFAIPQGTTAVHLVSRVGSPTEAMPWLEDRRRLGIYAKRIVLRRGTDMREIPLDHPDLAKGWWTVERDGSTIRRWTDGKAVLPLPKVDTVTMLEIVADAGGMVYATGVSAESRVA